MQGPPHFPALPCRVPALAVLLICVMSAVHVAAPVTAASEGSEGTFVEEQSATAGGVGEAIADARPVVDAVWKPQEFVFHYQSFTTFYSCSGLADKVKRILLALGADADTRVQVSGCEFGSNIAAMPAVRVRTVTLVEATPDALAELAKTRPQRELAARVRKDRGNGIAIDKPFAAQWERVSLSRGKLGIETGDCELIEQLTKRVLPRLAVRVIENKLSCMPNQQSFNQPRLEVDALRKVPTAEDVEKAKKNRT